MENYELIYEKENYYGEPLQLLTNFFDRLPKRCKVLDIGCGQGRDAIKLAELGFQVTGIDTCEKALDSLKKNTSAESSSVETLSADAYSFEDFASYDIILADSFFRFLKKDLAKETALINQILNEIKVGGIFVNCMKNTARSMENFSEIIMEHPCAFEILYDNYAEYPEFNELMHVFIIKKI